MPRGLPEYHKQCVSGQAGPRGPGERAAAHLTQLVTAIRRAADCSCRHDAQRFSAIGEPAYTEGKPEQITHLVHGCRLDHPSRASEPQRPKTSGHAAVCDWLSIPAAAGESIDSRAWHAESALTHHKGRQHWMNDAPMTGGTIIDSIIKGLRWLDRQIKVVMSPAQQQVSASVPAELSDEQLHQAIRPDAAFGLAGPIDVQSVVG